MISFSHFFAKAPATDESSCLVSQPARIARHYYLIRVQGRRPAATQLYQLVRPVLLARCVQRASGKPSAVKIPEGPKCATSHLREHVTALHQPQKLASSIFGVLPQNKAKGSSLEAFRPVTVRHPLRAALSWGSSQMKH
ncbi:unnamed protein product [Pleuronectes platessa]|uniref:Uncharacterized protein n=1 Tax=Pleuronectes platessa TaxID=8262 RepID=A0A9N7Y7L8_PLEPL|nr:unnamed protein product [Pleuronectes platessa]